MTSVQATLFQTPVEKPNLPPHLLDIQTVYHEPNVEKYRRGRVFAGHFA